MLKDLEGKRKTKERYIKAWLRYVKEHPDMPLQEQYKDKEMYRRAKNKWNDENSNISEYLAKRRQFLLDAGRKDLADLYLVYEGTNLMKDKGFMKPGGSRKKRGGI